MLRRPTTRLLSTSIYASTPKLSSRRRKCYDRHVTTRCLMLPVTVDDTFHLPRCSNDASTLLPSSPPPPQARGSRRLSTGHHPMSIGSRTHRLIEAMPSSSETTRSYTTSSKLSRMTTRSLQPSIRRQAAAGSNLHMSSSTSSSKEASAEPSSSSTPKNNNKYSESQMPFYALGTDLALHVSGGQGDIKNLLEDDELDIVLEGFCDQLRGGTVRRSRGGGDVRPPADRKSVGDEPQAEVTAIENHDEQQQNIQMDHEQFTQYVLMTYGQNLNKILHDRTQKVIQKVKDDGVKYIQDFVKEKKKQKLEEVENSDNNANTKLIQTDSGLIYYETKPGKGKSPNPNGECTVEIHYHGTLTDGTVFESTIDVAQAPTVTSSLEVVGDDEDSNTNNKYKSRVKKHSKTRGPQTTIIPLHGCIRGLQEGLKLMKEGGRATIIVPYELAYGDTKGSAAVGIIPPGATLTYDIELYEVRELQDFMKEHKISVNV